MTISLYYPYVSGLTNHAVSIAEHFSKSNNITVLTTRNDKRLPKKSVRKRVNIIRVNFLLRIGKGYLMPGYPVIAYNQVRSNDIVIINLPQLEAVIVAIIAKIFRKKIYSIYHCKVVLPVGFVNKFSELILNFSNALSLKLSDQVITYTQDYAKEYLSEYKNKLLFNYPPIKSPEVSSTALKKFSKLIPKEVYVLGVSARISNEKGIEYLLNAIPKIERNVGRDIVVVFAGPPKPVGENSYGDLLKPHIEKNKRKIVFLGNLDRGELGAFYKLIDVLVLPSINSTEAFGIVQVESMLAGAPVVASNLPGVRVPIIETGMGKLAHPKDSNNLAKSISEVLLNRTKHIKSKKNISEIFSEKKSFEKYESIFLN